MAAARPTLLRASRSWSSMLAATAAFRRGPSSRFSGPIALDARSRPAHAAGAQPLRGALGDLDVLRAGAAQADGVIQLAFSRDYSSADSVAQGMAEESAALAALGEELIGSDRPFVTR